MSKLSERFRKYESWLFYESDCIGKEVVQEAMVLNPGEVMVCENTRFYKQEDMKCKTDEDNRKQEAFAEELAKLGNVFVNDAFGTAHRAHASTAIICKFISPCVVTALNSGAASPILGILNTSCSRFCSMILNFKVNV